MFNFLKKIFSSKQTFKASITYESGYTSDVSELLEKATSFKNEKNFDEACLTLKKAFELGKDTIHLKDRLRLPMYLQLAKRNDEGWAYISQLFGLLTDSQSQVIISNQTRIFLQKEKRYLGAIPYGIYSYCKQIEQYRISISTKRNRLKNDEMAQMSYQRANEDSKIYQDGRWEENILYPMLELDNIEVMTAKLLKKAKKEIYLKELSNKVYLYIKDNRVYDFIEIKDICKNILLKENIAEVQN